MVWFVSAVWGFLALVGVLNWVLMPRPSGRGGEGVGLVALIPARDEAANLRELLPGLMEEVDRVIVFDDGSSDGTWEVARELGATVVRGGEELPEGWTGKNRACHELARVASEAASEEWWVFLDADTRVGRGFGADVRSVVAASGGRTPVLTGFPRFLPGAGLEPVYLFWVAWMLLCSIPFGLIGRSGLGHARFTNGQFVVWRAGRYWEVRPHERCRGEVLEDVQIGRLLAREGVRVWVGDFSRSLSVRMYPGLREAVDGMSKNSFWITGSSVGAVVLGVFLLGLSFSWVWGGWLAGVLMLASGVATVGLVRGPWWVVPFLPLSLVAAGLTQFRALVWVRSGRVVWKGRRYGG